MRERNAPRREKILIYQTVLPPVPIDGSKAWKLISRAGATLQTAEMGALSIVCGITWKR